jgi:hypothetical protein
LASKRRKPTGASFPKKNCKKNDRNSGVICVIDVISLKKRGLQEVLNAGKFSRMLVNAVKVVLKVTIYFPKEDGCAMLSAQGLKLVNKSLQMSYDDSGNKYDIPVFCINDPISIQDGMP